MRTTQAVVYSRIWDGGTNGPFIPTNKMFSIQVDALYNVEVIRVISTDKPLHQN